MIVVPNFYQNQWNNSWDIAFDNFFKRQRPPPWIFLQFDFLNKCYALDSKYVSSCKTSSKLVKRLERYRKRLNILLVWHENGYLHFFFAVFGNWNFSQFSSWSPSINLDFKILKHLVTHQLGKANMRCCVKFYQNWSSNSKDIVEVWIFHAFGRQTLICTFLRFFGVKNRRTLKLFAFPSLYEGNDLKLTLK